MIKRLDDYREPTYHRPHDKWVETPITTISETGETKTIVIKQRSLRSKRRIFTMSCTAFTVGMLMIVLASPYSNEFIVPGPLATNHAQILAFEGADRCSACHAAADRSLASWIANLMSTGAAQGLTQSELCMKCHDKSLNPDGPLQPHNVPPEVLANLKKDDRQVSYVAGLGFQAPVSGHKIACSACHREHHGSKADLIALTDNQCQVCHQNSYHRFETDHPEFTAYPLNRRSRIAFDHNSHAGKHFPGKQADFNCNRCHLDDDFQNVKTLASYEQACSECHHQQILESGSDGLALIALPMLDTDAIESAGLKIGSWPLAATGDFDGPLPPIMRVMLMADPLAAEALNRFGPAFDFSDIDSAKPENVRDAVELVWAIKRLLNDLALDGPRAVRTRLESVMQLKVTNEELQEMVTNLDEPVFQNAVRRWIPNLNAEVAAHRFGEPVSTRPAGNQRNDIAMQRSQLSWWPSQEDLLMNIAPDDLLAANPLVGLIKPDQASDENPNPLATVRVPDTAGQPTTQVDSLATPKFRKQAVRLKNQHADPMNDPELLAVNPLQTINDTPTTSPTNLPRVNTPQPVQMEITKTNPPPTNEEPNPGRKSGQLKSGQSYPRDQIAEYQLVNIDRPPIVVPSGWFRNDALFQISYRPGGHADRCVQSWIELVTRAADADTRPETKQLFERTISMTSIGLCRTCHTVDQLPDRSFAVNWKAEYRDPAWRSFTRFAHGPHMIQPKLGDCSHCHSLDRNTSNAESFVGFDSGSIVSNFFPMTKTNCATCHSANQTNNGCTQCHNYHVGSRITGVK